MKTALTILLLTLIMATSATGQERDDFLRPFFGIYGSQSLTTAIGNATVASGSVIPGKTNNPANLGFQYLNTAQATFLRGTFNSPAANQSQTSFGGLYAITPLPVYQGSLVFGYGIQREYDFTEVSRTPAQQYQEKGGLYATQLAFGVEMVEDFLVGAEFSYYQGSDQASLIDPEITSHLNPKYKGFGLSVGFVEQLHPQFLIGASVKLPTYMWVSEKFTEWQTDSTRILTAERYNYLLQRPFVFYFGGSYLHRFVNVFYELEWTEWKNLQFSSDEYFESDVVEINNDIQAEFRSTISHHLGLSGHLPWLPLHLYLGYQYLPTPYRGEYDHNRRQSWSSGFSYMLNENFSLHSSYTNYFWTYRGQNEDYQHLIFGASVHF